MKGIFVNENGGIRYAEAIVRGLKPYETRSRNMLGPCCYERVAIIRTRRGKKPEIIGYANIASARYMLFKTAADCFEQTLVPPGSKYAGNRWFYYMTDARPCAPYPLPKDAVRHGRSWCEFDI